ncbi:shikimate dehydrogenase [Clostridium sp. Cult3]|uniref:shikimate dehydrogenase n=1 Tax=Clostridium sp. Cult3 TaxID=2079004 RepID=UPI001F00D1D8|nr:shikimate dehydrogenase [Clostridium sp. Cult3]
MMNITWDTDVYCLIGHPVSKSLSPVIHNSFFELIDKNCLYLVFDVEEGNLKTIIDGIKVLNIKGFNVTLPYKINIIDYLDEISDEAKLIGAVNTVKNERGKLIGYNTDGMGFIRSLHMMDLDIKNKNMLILGAGGAANAIATTLALNGAKKIYINNRSIESAKRLAEKIKYQFPNTLVEYGGVDLIGVKKEKIYMIINCTSAGMYPNVDDIPIILDGFSDDLIVYDLIYKPRNTKLLKVAQDKGYRTINGLYMLINQGLYSQKIWIDDEKCNVYNYFDEIRRVLENDIE